MTTPTNQPTPQADRITAAEIRELFKGVHVEITEIRDEISALTAELEHMREGLTHASQPAPTVGTFSQMMIDTIIVIIDEKGTSYKAKGAPYQKHGVRVWPEALPLLGIDPAALKPGQNQLPAPIAAHVLMGETADDQGNTRQSPRKVTGRA